MTPSSSSPFPDTPPPEDDFQEGDRGWLDDLDEIVPDRPETSPSARVGIHPKSPIVLVETAFLASAATLIWLINFYFPIGPILLLFPLPISLLYLRWGNRAAAMAVLVSMLLISVLMGPVRSIQFLIPYGLLGWTLGALWQRRGRWAVTLPIGTVIANFGTFFKIWLVSAMLGEDLWLYFTMQVTGLLEWAVDKLGILWQPTIHSVQIATIVFLLFKDLMYTAMYHVVAWYLCDRLGNSIPDPPKLIQVIFNDV